MLSSRLQHPHLWADKENGTAGVSTRKPGSAYLSSAATAAKTPAAISSKVYREGSKTASRPSQSKAGPTGLSRTVAMEPGARVLGAKDLNNKQRNAQTAKKSDATSKASLDPDCKAIGPKVLFKSCSTAIQSVQRSTSLANQNALGRSKALDAKTPGKASGSAYRTPAKATRTNVLKTPAAPSQMPFSMYKTPSPNLLNRRKPGQFSPPIDFGSILAKTVVQEPTLLELLEARLEQIDESQEVEYAGASARDYDPPYQPDFDMPNYDEIKLSDACFYNMTAAFAAPFLDDYDEPAFSPLEYNEAELARPLLEPIQEPLFPDLHRAAASAAMTSGSSFRKSTKTPSTISATPLSRLSALSTRTSGQPVQRRRPPVAAPTRQGALLTAPAPKAGSASLEIVPHVDEFRLPRLTLSL